MQGFGIIAAWAQADGVSRSIAVILMIMSVMSWSVLVVKSFQLLRLGRMTQRARTLFWRASNFQEGVKALGSECDNPFVELSIAGHAADSHQYERSSELHTRFDLSDWLTRCLKDVLDDRVARMQAGLAILASIGSTSPFVGLFGTVWGIYHALAVIGASGDASLAQVAGPVGESLIMTAFGLFVAIPAVLGYNAMARRKKAVIHQLNRFAHDLHAFFLTGARVNLTATSSFAAKQGAVPVTPQAMRGAVKS